MTERRAQQVDISAIDLEDGWDADLDQSLVDKLHATIDENPPIILMAAGEAFRLVCGRHRLRAAMNAGHPSIWAEVREYPGPASARLQHLAENLSRYVPQGPERRAKLAEFVRMATEAATERSAITGHAVQEKPRRGRPKSQEKAAREEAAKATGVSERTVRRATAEPKPTPPVSIPKPPTFKARVRSAMVSVDEMIPVVQAFADETRERALAVEEAEIHRNPSAASVVLVHQRLTEAVDAAAALSAALGGAIREMERIESVLRQADKPTSERERRLRIRLGQADGSEIPFEPETDTEVDP